MNTKKAVFSKLFGKNTLSKTELKNVKIDLSLVDDIDNGYDFLEMTYSEATYGPELFEEWIDRVNEFNSEMSMSVDNFVVNGQARSFEEAADNMRVKIEELEVKAEELGISPDSLVSNYSEIKSILDNASAVNEDFNRSYQELRRETNERFGLADFGGN